MNGEEWRDEAACAEVGGDAWFPEKGSEARTAQKVCRSCPVQAVCLEYALGWPWIVGVWGGTTEQDRRRMRRRAA